MRSTPALRLVVITGLLGTLAACTSHPANPRDPLEPLNRKIYAFNDKADRWVMKPVAQGYHDYTPRPVRTGVSNFLSNLGEIPSALNYTLQGQPQPAFYSLARFGLNSTVGLLGVFDVTGEEKRQYEQTGFGDTFARWGWKNSSYFVMPLLGPSTLRDGTGTVGGMQFRSDVMFADLHRDVSTVTGVAGAIDTRERLLGVEEAINTAALDPYAYTRDGWLQIRAKKNGDDPVTQKVDDVNIDDLVQ